jgi:hypothetical protein
MIYTDDIVINYLNQIGNENPSSSQIESARKGLTDALMLKKIREERDRLIAATDWWVVADRTPTQAELDYRQALRDITDADLSSVTLDEDGNPINVPWPVNPNIIVVPGN